ncbi:MAG: DUF1697 domain-containing protein [Bacteroidia bacterium]
MNIYIAILRGINVSGKRILKMDALKQMLNELGFENVQTYIQSGNIVFKAKKISNKLLEAKIASEIEKQFGYDVPTLVLTINELKFVIDNNPFVTNKLIDPAHLHITFLNEEPQKELTDKILPSGYLPDQFNIISKAVYLYCPNGYGSTKLSNTFLENKLKVNATTRNWKTVNELLSIAEKTN